MACDAVRPSRLACLDGLRGAAIALVILAHFRQSAVADGMGPIRGPLRLVHDSYGGLVTLFFVLSGYLITRLLVRERLASGTISLPRFYLRRVLRIFPPAGLYLLVLFVCTSLELMAITGRSFVAAGLVLSKYLRIDTCVPIYSGNDAGGNSPGGLRP